MEYATIIAAVVKLLPALVIALAILSGASYTLEKIKDLTATQTDNKIAAVVSKIVALLQKVVDFLSANRAH